MPNLSKPLIVPEYGNWNQVPYQDSAAYSVGLQPHAVNLFTYGQANLLAAVDLDTIFTGLGIDPTQYLPSPNVCLAVSADLYVAISGLPVTIPVTNPTPPPATIPQQLQPAAAILKFTGYFAGKNETTTVTPTIFTESASGYCGLAFDGAGNLYSVENQNSIYAYPIAQNGTVRNLVYQGNSEDFGDLAFDASGNLWAADYNNNSVVAFPKPTPGGPNSRTIVVGGTGPFPVLNGGGAMVDNLFVSPEGVGFDGAGNLWVGNNNDGYDAAGVSQNSSTTLVELTAKLLPTIISDATLAGSTYTLNPTQALTSGQVVSMSAPISGFAVYQAPTPTSPYLPQFGGLQIDVVSPQDLPSGNAQYLYVNDEVDNTVWQLDVNPYSPTFLATEPSFASAALTLTDAQGNPAVTNPGNGGIALVRASLLIQDDTNDTGAEPDVALATTGTFWESPSIGVGANSTPPSPPFTSYESIDLTAGQSYWVYVNVQNIGCTPTTGTETLHVYWASGATIQSWPGSWTPITTGDVGVPIQDNSGNPLTPGQSYVFAIPWADVPSSATNTHFCLLARIQTSPVYPYGMTYWENMTTPGNMRENVTNNAKIAQTNIHIYAETPRGPGGHVYRFPIAVGNLRPEPSTIGLALQLLNADATPAPLGESRLVIHVEPGLRDRFAEDLREVASHLGNGAFHIHHPERGLERIRLRAGEMAPLSIEFTPAPDLRNFVLRAVQYRETHGEKRIEGGQTFIVGKVRGFTVT